MTIKTIGIIGGGQLGRMLALAAAPLGFKTHVYCPEADCPASHVTNAFTQKPYDDSSALKAFASQVDVITLEFENIPVETLKTLNSITPVHPSWQALHISQNRLREKQFMRQLEIAVTPFHEIKTLADLEEAFEKIGTDCLLKTAELGYDGKGQCWIDDNSNLKAIWETFNTNQAILEAFVPFETELSVIIARTENGKCSAFPVMENTHKDGILIETVVPARLDADICDRAVSIAITIAQALKIVGLLTVEFFYTDEGEILVNEIAPRPHNSGHWTLDGCVTSQFEQCIRAIAGLPLGDTTQHTAIRMINLIGEGVLEAPRYLGLPNAKLHLYGKALLKSGRKMGHVNMLEGPPVHAKEQLWMQKEQTALSQSQKFQGF